VFGAVPRIVLASVAAFWAGEFVNAFVLARLKVLTKGRFLWMRTIGSTFAGQGVDSASSTRWRSRGCGRRRPCCR
jgi:uncharacterized PurR-regulated membrane protein YhhQ (DUF165 family)